MQLKHRVDLNGVQLDEVDPRIIIQGVSTRTGKTSVTAVSLYGRDGQRLTGMQRDTLDVEVSFGLLIRSTDMLSRAALLDTVNQWAALALREYGGAWLSVNYKENRRIHVYLVDPAEEGDLIEYANTFRLTFRAYGVPYWQEAVCVPYVSPVGSIQYGQITVNGTVRTVADITLKNESGDLINTCSVTAGRSVMSFFGLGMVGGESLVIDHDEEGRLRLRILNIATGVYRSVYAKRNPGSADDLYVMPGIQTVGFSAQRACSMTAGALGRYL